MLVLPQKTVRPSTTVAQKRHFSARAVGTFVPKLTRQAFERFGFSTAQLLTDWPQIVGAALAQTTSPDRIVWPRHPTPAAQESARGSSRAGAAAPRVGATLHLRVDPARALDVQYKTQQLVERINAYFGYRAIAELRIVQVRMDGMPAGAAPTPPQRARALRPEDVLPLDDIRDDRLRAALDRMQQGLSTRRR